MKNYKNLSILSILMPSIAQASGYTFLGQVSASTHLPEHTLTLSLVVVLLMITLLVYNFKIKNVSDAVIPDEKISLKNILESYGEFILGLSKTILGEKRARTYFKTLSSIFLIIFVSNVIGLIPGFLPPTDNLNTTVAFGLCVFIYYNLQGIKVQGLWGHIKHFMGPVIFLAPLILPLEIISHVVRPVSLGLRLRGNMFGDHLVLSIFSGLIPYIAPIVFYVIGLFVCFMQSFVFTLLTMVYIGLSTEEHHDHGDEVEHH